VTGPGDRFPSYVTPPDYLRRLHRSFLAPFSACSGSMISESIEKSIVTIKYDHNRPFIVSLASPGSGQSLSPPGPLLRFLVHLHPSAHVVHAKAYGDDWKGEGGGSASVPPTAAMLSRMRCSGPCGFIVVRGQSTQDEKCDDEGKSAKTGSQEGVLATWASPAASLIQDSDAEFLDCRESLWNPKLIYR
jgi:hypothetical protein